MITLTPLSSSASSSSTSEPVAYYLELDDARILLDMGQRDYRASAAADNWEYEEKIRELAPTLSLVLLSHSPTRYLGLYPYARAHWGLKCPVYATQPTVEMGRVVCLSEAESWRAECPVPEVEDDSMAVDDAVLNKDKGKKPFRGPFVPTVEQIHEAFDWIKATRYNQPLHLGGELSHLLLTPFPSGHVLGGTLFKIRSPTSGTVLYAVGMNHTGERHLDGMVTGQGGLTGYAEDIRRPELLIVEGDRSLVVNPKRRDRETAILDLVTSTLQGGHSVLLPCDPSPRLLELLVLLDQHWTFKLNPAARAGPSSRQDWNYPLCLVSRTGQDMVSFARSLIEWMGGIVRESGTDDVVMDGKKRKRKQRQFTNIMSEYGALDFSHVKFFSSPAELLQAFPLNRPKLVLAVPPTMSHGPSRFLFSAMANAPGNVILLTNRGEDDTLARDLYTRWEAEQDDSAKFGLGKIGVVKEMSGSLTIEMDSKVPLAGAELEAYEEEERQKKEREAAHQAALDRSRRMLEADDLDSDSDSDSEAGSEADMPRTERPDAFGDDGEDVRTMSFDIFVKGQQMRVGRGAVGEMARFRMFPYIAKGRKVDSYGEGLDIGQWIRKGREIEEEGETEEVREARRRKQEEEERAKLPPEPPSKFVSENVTIDLHASLEYVDMDGLHDGQAIKTIIADLQPRKLVIVQSTPASTQALLDFFASSATMTDEIFHPATNDVIRIGEHVQSYSLQLGDSISALLNGKWSKFEGYEVAMVDGKLAFASGSTVPMLEAAHVELPPAVEVREEVEGEAAPEEQAETKPEGEAEQAEARADGDVEMEEKPDGETEATAEGEANGEGETETEVVKAEPEAEAEPAPAPEVEEPKTEPEPEPEVKKEPSPAMEVDLTPAPALNAAPAPLPSSLFIGDLRLVHLKNRLASLSIPAEFAGEGMLVCGPGVLARTRSGDDKKAGGAIVAVRKLGEGEVVLEGAISATYFAVRKELYGSYAQVTTV